MEKDPDNNSFQIHDFERRLSELEKQISDAVSFAHQKEAQIRRMENEYKSQLQPALRGLKAYVDLSGHCIDITDELLKEAARRRLTRGPLLRAARRLSDAMKSSQQTFEEYDGEN